MDWHLAQLNVARLLAPVDDPAIADFYDNLDNMNSLAERSPGYVWRLQTDEGDATALHPIDDDELIIINLTVWEDVKALADYVFRSDHAAFLRRRGEWFERYGSAYLALWWVPAGTLPTIDDALARLAHIEQHGPTPTAFTFARRFALPDDGSPVDADVNDVCLA